MTVTKKFKVRGMDCAEETSALKATVGVLKGVSELTFNLMDGTMTVLSTSGEPSDDAIKAAARKAGLEAEGFDPNGTASPVAVTDGGWHGLQRGFMCGCSGAFVAFGFCAHVLTHGFAHALGEGSEAGQRFPILAVCFYAGAAVMGGWFVVPKAWASLRRFKADMNLLMTIAVIGAMGIGEWFEAGTVAFLFSLSLVLESWSVGRARRAIHALVSLTPPTARYVCPHDGDIEEKPVADVPLGVTVLVRPGERIPLDGVIVKGQTTVNQAPITGESMPVAKGVGDTVFAGAINDDGAFEFRSTKTARDTTLAGIIRMVEAAQSRRAPVEQWVEKFAQYYTPIMILLAVLVAVVPPLLDGMWVRWFYEGLVILVIACPCALVISTPVSIVAALTAATRVGVLIKGGEFLEAMAGLKAIALDKTGTLTKGMPEVQEVLPLDGHTRNDLLARVAALELGSEHPLAKAVLKKAREENVEPLVSENFRALKGRGAEATIDGRVFWLGSHRLLHEKGVEDAAMHAQAQRVADAGHSVIVVGNDRHVCGLISVADSVRPESAGVVRALLSAGVQRVVMLTGDNRGTAEAVGKAVGIDSIHAELLPEDKLKVVEKIRQDDGPVAMVGDGINDAPALAAASVGIAMGAAGSDAAVETADIALMSDDLTRLPWLILHAKRSLQVIKQNIVFALSMKAVFMILAILKMATLWMAIAADMGASLLVIFNALRLLRTK